MRVMTKVILMASVSLASLSLVGGLGWYATNKLHRQNTHLVSEQFLPLVNQDIAHLTEDLQTSMMRIVDASRETFRAVVAEKMALVSSEVAELKAAATVHDQAIAQAKAVMAQAEAGFDTDAAKALCATFNEQFAQWEEKTRKVVAGAGDPAKVTFSRRMSNGGSAEKTFVAMQETLAALEQAQRQQVDLVLASVNQKKAQVEQQARVIDAEANRTIWIFLTLGVTAFVVTITLAVWIGRGLVRSIRKLVEIVKDIASGEGDLTRRVASTSNDELGELAKWFDVFIAKIHDIILQVSRTTREVASAATQIAASSDQMATGMKEQSTQVIQISSAVEEMSASVVEVARKSNDAAANATESGKVAEQGGQVVNQTIDGMRAIKDAVSASAESVQELGKRGEQIGQIIAVINDIADQTNLLALNAAIEAARAGEHGRGFAVVADEVRKLADRTTKATEEIGQSITAIQTETSQAVERMTNGTSRVNLGVDWATEAGVSLQQIVAKARDVAGMIQSIAAAAEQQSAASEEISRNLEAISTVTRTTSEGVDQAATAANDLSLKAEELQRLVGQFKLAQRAAA